MQRRPSRVLPSITQVCRELTRHLEDRNFEDQHHLRNMSKDRCIWTGRCFAEPASVVLQNSLSLEPALHTVESSLAAGFKGLLLLLGVSCLIQSSFVVNQPITGLTARKVNHAIHQAMVCWCFLKGFWRNVDRPAVL